MKRAILLASLLVATPAFGQDVDIQVRLGVPATVAKSQPVIQANVEIGSDSNLPYQNANENVPYVPVRWLCVTDAYFQAYAVGSGNGNIVNGDVNVQWVHQRPGHSYHGLTLPPMPISRLTPMAFPPGEPIELRVNNRTGKDVFIRTQLAGFLGRDASATRAEACR